MKKIDMSVIIPVYNVEEYLSECVDSLMHQGDLDLEIILINDGSTDNSGVIADQYAERDNRINVIHQDNGGASAARNAGLERAKGEYIAFLDSDDWIKKDSLCELYHEAIKYQADVVMGNLMYYRQGKIIDNNNYNLAPKEIRYIPFSGKEGFIRLAKVWAYAPMACNYIYRKNYLVNIQARFEEGIMAEDELWSPVVLCQAEKMVIVDVNFYCYRQREGSVMQSAGIRKRLDALFRVTDRLFAFADRFTFLGDNGELKNWLYVIIFLQYSSLFKFLSKIKDTLYIVPEHHLNRFWRDCWEMMPEPREICSGFFYKAEAELKKYINWRTSDWVASIATQIKTEKKMMLIYNTIYGKNLSLKVEDVPADWVITTDRRYFLSADAVVFHLPSLQQELEEDLEKPEGQIWISWYLESEKDHPLFNEPEIKDTFEMWICCLHDADEEHPLLRVCRESIM